MACKHEVLKPGGYVECDLEGPGVACIASDSDLTQRDCDCYEDEEAEKASASKCADLPPREAGARTSAIRGG